MNHNNMELAEELDELAESLRNGEVVDLVKTKKYKSKLPFLINSDPREILGGMIDPGTGERVEVSFERC